jgi:hypothetical protein
VNEVDDEEVPPTLRGPGWEFVYMEDEYHLPHELKSVACLHFGRFVFVRDIPG